jgi:glycosyltransferase involved in cell wall biosynthesis
MEPSEKLRLLHAGSFYGMRSPLPLLEGLRRCGDPGPLSEKLEMVFVGDVPERYRQWVDSHGLSNIVAFRRAVTYVESLGEAARADVLVLVDAPTDGPSPFLPSKLVDYLMFRKPVLGITPLDGASADVLRRLGYPIASPDDPDAVASAIERLVECRRTGQLGPSAVHDAVAADYDIVNTTHRLDGVVRSIS